MVRRGLTLVTAAVLTLLLLSLATATLWSVVVSALYGRPAIADYLMTLQLPKIEAVALDRESNEILVNARIRESNRLEGIGVYIARGGSLRSVPIEGITVEYIGNLLLIRVRLSSNIEDGEYVVRAVIGNKNVEVKFAVV